jgi:hypothetical protein
MSGGGMGFAPMAMGSFAPNMGFSPMAFPTMNAPAQPVLSAPISNPSIYSVPVTNTVIAPSPAPSYVPASVPAQTTYSYQGQYCNDASGGQVWVPSGGATDGLICGVSATSSGSGLGSNNGNSGSSSYAP